MGDRGITASQISMGATDLVCLYKGRPVIVDFKQTNTCQEHYSKVQDYYTQLVMYGEAHTSQYTYRGWCNIDVFKRFSVSKL